MSRTVSSLMLTLLLVSILAITSDVKVVEASSTIYIRANGSIDPPTANITSIDNVTYTFTNNNYDEIVVERSDITIDGNGYTLQGNGTGTGFYLSHINNTTITNTNIKNFSQGLILFLSFYNKITTNSMTSEEGYGIVLEVSLYNTISNNNITNHYSGIWLSEAYNNSISGNYLASNRHGIDLSAFSNNNKFYHNNRMSNIQPVNTRWPSYANSWDNDNEGNYWSNYNGTDLDGDGIGDTSYIIDANNTDNYSLMNLYWNPADIDHDLDVDIFDIARCAVAPGSTPSDPNWNPHCDISEPYGKIDIFDIVMIAGSYGEEQNP